MNITVTDKVDANLLPMPEDSRGGIPSVSALGYLELCKGRHIASRLIKKRDSKDSSEGTRLHSLMTLENPVFESVEDEIVITKCHELINQGREICGFEDFIPSHVISSNVPRLWLHVDGMPILSGEFDRLEIYGNVGIIFDFKMLWGDHGSASNNLQLMGYAVQCSHFYGLKKVFCVLVCPQLGIDKRLTVTCYDGLSFPDAEARMVTIAIDALNPDMPRCAGPKQCEFCHAKPTCKEANSSLMVQFFEMINPDSEMTLAQKFKVRAFVKTLYEGICDAMDEEAKELLAREPHAIEGWKLMDGKTTYAFNEPLTALELLGIDARQAVKDGLLSLSMTKLAEAHAVKSKCKKKDAVNATLAILGETVTVKTGDKYLKKV